MSARPQHHAVSRSTTPSVRCPEAMIRTDPTLAKQLGCQFNLWDLHRPCPRNAPQTQGKNNVLLFPAPAPLKPGQRRGICCRERLGGLLRYFYDKVVKVKADVAAILKFFLPMPQIEADHHDAAPVVPIGGMRKGGFSGAL